MCTYWLPFHCRDRYELIEVHKLCALVVAAASFLFAAVCDFVATNVGSFVQ